MILLIQQDQSSTEDDGSLNYLCSKIKKTLVCGLKVRKS